MQIYKSMIGDKEDGIFTVYYVPSRLIWAIISESAHTLVNLQKGYYFPKLIEEVHDNLFIVHALRKLPCPTLISI